MITIEIDNMEHLQDVIRGANLMFGNEDMDIIVCGSFVTDITGVMTNHCLSVDNIVGGAVFVHADNRTQELVAIQPGSKVMINENVVG